MLQGPFEMRLSLPAASQRLPRRGMTGAWVGSPDCDHTMATPGASLTGSSWRKPAQTEVSVMTAESPRLAISSANNSAVPRGVTAR
ncbi:MAG: hypothetical protein BWX47_01464 [candidate division Hyd24-12 bacterium ADurb.Bin004]|nr:MAG: hypothetical protein AO394_06075 [Candidatus Fermentibacter daniensis]OQC69035.1 MAG: hypothetical protein BWX47_01464 [candidate division Hyd24-12 bacterium ADurb.Bin004]